MTFVRATVPTGETAEIKFTGLEILHFDSRAKRVRFMELVVQMMGGTLMHKVHQRILADEQKAPA